jgi:hypothetical protein
MMKILSYLNNLFNGLGVGIWMVAASIADVLMLGYPQ